MNVTTRGGILIGVLCGLWTFVMGFTGWYKDPALLYAFWLVIPIQIGVLIWGLRKVTSTGKQYGGLVGAGTLMSAIGGVILIFISLLFTTVVFPEYFNELRAIQEEMLRNSGQSEAEIAAALEASSQTNTPIIQALFGCIGTVVTGFLASLIIGAVVKKKIISQP
ncbi:MAG: DUF4199 domain-containing protein [Ignavibacteriae bacterium]|nr:DUF4199 domain-containing protein [Ignavibacteriota bacterium]